MKIRFALLICTFCTAYAIGEIKSDDVPGSLMDSGQLFTTLDEPTPDDVRDGLDDHHSNHYEW